MHLSQDGSSASTIISIQAQRIKSIMGKGKKFDVDGNEIDGTFFSFWNIYGLYVKESCMTMKDFYSDIKRPTQVLSLRDGYTHQKERSKRNAAMNRIFG